jgi:predicted dehydrogenase
MKQINVGIIGPGWCGGIRAETCAASALINELHLAEIRPDRLAEISEITNPTTTTDNYHELLGNPDIDAIYICATPEGLHYSMARDSLLASKHVFMEKPIAVTLGECDELTNIAKKAKLKFSIGYSQRFNQNMPM